MPTIPRESVEYVPVTVSRNGAPVTANVSFALTGAYDRPTLWTAAVLVDGGTAVLVRDQPPGRYQLWARVLDGDEAVVVAAGSITID